MKGFILGLVAFVAILLSGCTKNVDIGLAPPVQIPELPAALATKAEPLPGITDRTLGGILVDSATASSAYNAVAHNNNRLIDFYNCIKTSINNKTDPDLCL